MTTQNETLSTKLVSFSGAPLISKVVWIILRLSSLSDQDCPFLDIVKWDVVLEAPILTLLVINFLFLTWVVIVSLRSNLIKNIFDKSHVNI